MPTNRKTVTSIEARTWLATLPKVGSSPPQKFSAKMSARKPATATTMKIAIGTILAKVAMVLSAAASLTPRRIRTCTPHSRADAATMATGVVPSPKIGKNWPSVALIRTRQATSARQQPIQ